jgi:group I intron endonuclease
MNKDEKNGSIYLITNMVNGKYYVGQHKSVEPQIRWKKHLVSARGGSPYALHSAIRKYGEDNFKIELLCICPHSRLGNMEPYYAEQFGTYVWDPIPGYNMVWCGTNFRLGITHTQEAREKLRKSNTGKIQSKETVEKRIKALTGLKRNLQSRENIKQGKKDNPISEEGMKNIIKANTGKKMSEEARKNMRESRKNAKLLKNESNIEMLTKIKQKYPCTYDECDKILSSKNSLKLHLRIHNCEKPFQCKKCDKAFACGSNLDQHGLTHTDERPHECSECDFKFKTESALNKHIKRIHLKVNKESNV